MNHLCESSTVALSEISTKAAGKKIVFVSGNFNVIHPGHLRLIRFARELGDYLVIGVLDTKSPDAIVQEQLRLDGVTAISWVDYAFLLRDKPEDFVAHLRPAFIVKGKEHETENNPEEEIIRSYGGKLLFGSGDMRFSSVDLLRREFLEVDLSNIQKPHDFARRHQFQITDLLADLSQMQQLRVCVVGDVIVDEYITCDALGMSQEDPTLVVAPVSNDRFIGGAGIVAAHARGIGKDVRFFTVCGIDEAADFVRKEIKNRKVTLHCYEDESRHTTLKQRFRADNKTLLRVSHLHQHAISNDIQKQILKDMADVFDEIDLLLFADFNYGCLPQHLVDKIIVRCREKRILMAADSQSSSQIGDVSRFHDMALLTPTERELRLAVHDFESGIVVCAEKLRSVSAARNVVVTLGREGILIHAETDSKNKWLTDRLPALNKAPKDVAGAGDSFLTCAAMALAAGSNIWRCSAIGSLAAACQVGRVGNIPISPDELKSELKN